MKKTLSFIMIIFILMNGIGYCEVVRTDDAVVFLGAVDQLKHINSRESVEDAQQNFRGITSNYNQSNLFAIYASAIIDIYDESYDDAQTKIDVLSMNDDFIKLLTKYELQSCEVLQQYIEGRRMEDTGDYQGALTIYATMNFLDSPERMISIMGEAKEQAYAEAQSLFDAGAYEQAAEAFRELGNYKDSVERAEMSTALIPTPSPTPTPSPMPSPSPTPTPAPIQTPEPQRVELSSGSDMAVRQVTTISASNFHSVALCRDGTVVTAKDEKSIECQLDNWSDIVAVSAGQNHTLGLHQDGTVVASGYNENGECNVGGWSDIVAIATGDFHSIGLRRDGTVVSTGNNNNGQCNVNNWSDIVAITAGTWSSAAIRKNGTVVTTGGNYNGESFDVSEWSDIIAIDANGWTIVGLRADGTVVATGWNENGECNVDNWSNIISIGAGWNHTVGLCSDGTVVAVGSNQHGQCNVDNWSDIVAICVGDDHTLGLRSDGTVLATGWNNYGQCDVKDWTDIAVYN